MTQATPTPPAGSDFSLLEELVERHATPPLNFGGEMLPYEIWRQDPDRASLDSLDEADYEKLTDEDRYTIACNRLISNGLTPGSGFVPILYQSGRSGFAWLLETHLRAMRAFRDITYVCRTASANPGPDFVTRFIQTQDLDACADSNALAHRQASTSLVETATANNLVDILRQLEQLNLVVQVSNDLKTIPFTLKKILAITEETNNA